MSVSSPPLSVLERVHLDRLISASLDEDVAEGDVTTLATISSASISNAQFLAKSDGILSGLAACDIIFHTIDPSLLVSWSFSDGQAVTSGTIFGNVRGSTRSLLVAERLVLNLMQRMSGIATAAGRFVSAVSSVGSSTVILDTRKTVPGLRLLDKMAVRHGGARNHRIGLYDMVMIKDNHVMASGGIAPAIRAVKEFLRKENKEKIKIEVETRTLEEVREALAEGGFHRIMLDNMVKVTRTSSGALSVDTSDLQEALKLIDGKFETEASGNVTIETVGEIAKTKVNFISTGAITHSVSALDISLKIK